MSQFSDGFPKDPQAAIAAAYFLSESEKAEWYEWISGATPEQKDELVDILHSMWIENQNQKASSSPEPNNSQEPDKSTNKPPQPNLSTPPQTNSLQGTPPQALNIPAPSPSISNTSPAYNPNLSQPPEFSPAPNSTPPQTKGLSGTPPQTLSTPAPTAGTGGNVKTQPSTPRPTQKPTSTPNSRKTQTNQAASQTRENEGDELREEFEAEMRKRRQEEEAVKAQPKPKPAVSQSDTSEDELREEFEAEMRKQDEEYKKQQELKKNKSKKTEPKKSIKEKKQNKKDKPSKAGNFSESSDTEIDLANPTNYSNKKQGGPKNQNSKKPINPTSSIDLSQAYDSLTGSKLKEKYTQYQEALADPNTSQGKILEIQNDLLSLTMETVSKIAGLIEFNGKLLELVSRFDSSIIEIDNRISLIESRLHLEAGLDLQEVLSNLRFESEKIKESLQNLRISYHRSLDKAGNQNQGNIKNPLETKIESLKLQVSVLNSRINSLTTPVKPQDKQTKVSNSGQSLDFRDVV